MDETLKRKEEIASGVSALREIVTLCKRFQESDFADHPMKAATGQTGLLGTFIVLGIFALTDGKASVPAEGKEVHKWLNDKLESLGAAGFMKRDSARARVWTPLGRKAIESVVDEEWIQWLLLETRIG